MSDAVEQEAEASLSAARSADAAARERAQTLFDRPLVLEAGAGTGKTATLVARVMAWLFGPGWERAAERERERSAGASASLDRDAIAADVLTRVAAITFTEAAAAEMAERVALALEDIIEARLPTGLLEESLPADPAERRQRALDLRAQLDQFGVRTIHGFCRRVLSQHPIEAGLSPTFTVDADATILAACARDAVEAAMAEQYGAGGDAPLVRLAVAGVGAQALEETIVQLVSDGVPPEWFANDPYEPGRVAAFHEQLCAAAQAFVDAGGQALGEVSGSRTASALEAIEGLRALPAPAGTEDGCAPWFAAAAGPWEEANRTRLRDWQRGAFKKNETLALGDRAADVARAAGALMPAVETLCNADPERAAAVCQALGPLLETVTRAMDRAGALPFAGLLHRTQWLLASRPAVAQRVREGIDQLLIDEFQDTDSTQCDIVRRLAFRGDVGSRPGLFLVGDPKQSIYGWRNADLEAYEGFVAELLAAQGERHSLRVNFRSVPAVLDEVARVIEPVMRAEPGVQPPFESLIPCEARAGAAGFTSPGPGGHAPVEHWVGWAWDEETNAPAARTSSERASQLEAVALADDLRRLHDEHSVEWRDVGVLLRATTEIEVLLTAFRERGIPHAVANERSFYRRREVADAALLARLVLEPRDRLAFVAWLRSTLVAVPDAALFPLLRAGVDELAASLGGDDVEDDVQRLSELEEAVGRAARDTPHDVPGDVALAGAQAGGGKAARGWCLRLVAAFEALAALRRSLRTDAPDVFVERMRRWLPAEAVEASRHLGAFRAASLDRFFRELRDELVQRGELAAVARWLRMRVEQGGEPSKEPLDPGADAVRVMTVHAAKGLDFDHVYLMQTHRVSQAGRAATALRVEQVEGVAEFQVLGARSLGYAEVACTRAAVERAEHVRTLYVALTRARDRLVVSGAWPVRDVEDDAREAAIAGAASHAVLVAQRGTRIDHLQQAMIERAAAKRLARERKRQAGSGSAGANRDVHAEAKAAHERAATAIDGVLFSFPALAVPPTAGTAAVQQVDSGAKRPSEERDGRDGSLDEWVAREEAARARMRRTIAGRASASTHGAGVKGAEDASDGADRGEWRERLAQRDADGAQSLALAPVGPREGAGHRRAALAAGTAIHHLLEMLDLALSPEDARAWLSAGLETVLEQVAEGPVDDELRARAQALLRAFFAGPMLEALLALRGQVVARELPLLLPPGYARPDVRGAEAGSVEHRPLGYVAGAIDLVYRDARSGGWVVADYKTDRVEAADDIDAFAERHRAQLELYGAALRDGLGLEAAPRLELWFIAAGRIVTL